VSGVAILTAAAIMLGFAAVAELLAARTGSRSQDRGRGPWSSGRWLTAALHLGLPARMARAGPAGQQPLSAVLGAKLGGALFGLLIGLQVAPAAPGRLSVLVALGVPVAGFLVPDALLERAARRRRRRLIEALPDALDLLAVSTAAGRTAAAGFAELARGGEGPLAEELGVTVAEIGCGVPSPLALRALRERMPGSGLASLCAAIERSRVHGSPLAEQLRRQAGALRRDQSRATEERAARAAPKIQLVVALVLVPSVLLMIVAGLLANSDSLLSGF
jgi:tight adherence protein C